MLADLIHKLWKWSQDNNLVLLFKKKKKSNNSSKKAQTFSIVSSLWTLRDRALSALLGAKIQCQGGRNPPVPAF